MREQPPGKMLGLSALLLVGLFLAAGCNSTAALPSTVARDPVANAFAGLPPAPSAGETTWKKTTPVHSTAPRRKTSGKTRTSATIRLRRQTSSRRRPLTWRSRRFRK